MRSGVDGGMEDRTDRRTQPRQRLLDVDEAARRVIMRKGLAATTLRDISRDGGFTTGVLTHYFADKEALIFGVFSNASDRWIAKARAALAGADSIEGLFRALVDVCIPSDPDERREWRLWTEMWTYAGGNQPFSDYVIETDALWERELRDVLERAVREKVLPADLDVAIEARIFARLVDGLGTRSVLDGRWDDARTALTVHLRSLGLAPRVLEALTAAPARGRRRPRSA